MNFLLHASLDNGEGGDGGIRDKLSGTGSDGLGERHIFFYNACLTAG